MSDDDNDRVIESIVRGETQLATGLLGTVGTLRDGVAFLVRMVGPHRVDESIPEITGWLGAMIAAFSDPIESGHAPSWVQSVTPAEIVRQRAEGWPDFHPEDFCHQCGRRNPNWHVDSEIWNPAVVDRLDRGIVTILCPSCLCVAWQEATGLRVSWDLQINPRSRTLREAAVAIDVALTEAELPS